MFKNTVLQISNKILNNNSNKILNNNNNKILNNNSNKILNNNSNKILNNNKIISDNKISKLPNKIISDKINVNSYIYVGIYEWALAVILLVLLNKFYKLIEYILFFILYKLIT